MDEEYIEQQQEDMSDVQEDMVEMQEDMTDVPTQKRSQDLYSLFDKVRTTSDSTKVGNLNNTELGNLNITVRDSQRMSLIGRTFHHKKFADFYKGLGEITLGTSASKKGWLVELFVTSKKFSSKLRSSNSNPDQLKQKYKLWNKNKQAESESQ